MLFFAPTGASVLIETVTCPTPEIVYRYGSCVVSIEGIPSLGRPAEPLLPVYALKILLPQGEEVSNVIGNVSYIEEIRIAFPVACAQEQVPLTQAVPAKAALPDPDIYSGEGPFPEARVVHVTTQTYRGYNIAFFNVYPVTYLPADGKLVYAPRIEVVVETVPSARMRMRSLGTLRAKAGDRAALGRMVRDAGPAMSYASAPPVPTFGGLVEPEDSYPYVIVTSFFVRELFEPLKDFKDSTGLRTRIVHTGDINYYYSGANIKEKIRNFIKDAYANWETEYVLLAFDDELIPHRGLYAEAAGKTDLDIPSDLYYGALDGTWNDDGDAYWGEPGEEDLMPEVSVGRLCVGDSAEAVTLIDKIMKYERSPVAGQVLTALMAGENFAGGTSGADHMNEIRDGSSAHGYTTAGIDGAFAVDSLYDRDFAPGEWDKDDLLPLLNDGRHLVNHIGHCRIDEALRLTIEEVDTSFTNDGDSATYFVLYTQGCYAGSFDNRTPWMTYVGDAVGERFTLIENGAVAFVGNTRYGFYSSGNTRGASQYFHRQFTDAVFGEGITAIGRALDDSRIDNIAYLPFEAMRWVYYGLVLLGDPSMDIWTDVPDTLEVAHPDTVYAYENEVTIDVSGSLGPVAGARVALFTDDTYSMGLTDSSGTCILDPLVESPGDIYLTVSAHNFYPYLDTLTVAVAGGALVTLEDFTIDDDMIGASSGNSDGEVDAGETIESEVTLRNAGQDTAYNVTAQISTASPYVTLIDSTGIYGDIPPDSVVTPSWSFAYSLSASCPDSEAVDFDLDLDYSGTNLIRHFTVVVSAPELSITGISFSDTLYGNADGCIEAGETLELTLAFENLGSGDAIGTGVKIEEFDTYVTLDLDSAYIDTIATDSTRVTSPAYIVTLSPDCPDFHEINLDIVISFDSGRQASDSTVIYVGGSLEDNFEAGNSGWTHCSLWPTYFDNWHLEDYRNHTAGGTYSWKYGGSDSLNYSNYSYGALVTPELCLAPNATLTFWHYIRAEVLSQSVAWDGGILEISTDGGETWSLIQPVGGYTHTIYGNSHCPLPEGTPCFGRNNNWTQVQFDLSAYEGRARIRFVFASGAIVTDEGWYIDDITISDDAASVVIDPEGSTPDRFALHALAPNPVISQSMVAFDVPGVSRVKIQIFDVNGRVVDVIVDSNFQPGRYSLSWSPAGALAPGVYFIRMEARAFDRTSKVIVLR